MLRFTPLVHTTLHRGIILFERCVQRMRVRHARIKHTRLDACAMLFVALSLLAGSSRECAAQTLDLGAAIVGPNIDAPNAALELADVLDAEAQVLLNESAKLANEAKSTREASAKLRNIGAYLLRIGATRPWDASGAVVAGMRVAALRNRIDALMDNARSGISRSEGKSLSDEQTRASIALIARVAGNSIDALRAALATPSNSSELTALSDALALVLAPLIELAQLYESSALPNAWPVVSDARDDVAERIDSTPAPDAIAARIAVIQSIVTRTSFARALATIAAQTNSSTRAGDLSLIDAAAKAVEWIEACAAKHSTSVLSADAVTQSLAHFCSASDTFAPSPTPSSTPIIGNERARAQLGSLNACVDAARAMVELRALAGVSEANQRALSIAASTLITTVATDANGERVRVRAARRIEEACAAAFALEKAANATPPRDLKDAIKLLNRKARFAQDALPSAFVTIANDPATAGDPATASALARVVTLEQDRLRIATLQSFIDAITAIRPSASHGFGLQARRLARMLTDDARRADAQLAFATLERQCEQALPLAYETQLKDRAERARVLTGESTAEILDAAGRARAAWADALARGDFGGEEARRLDAVARMCRALSDLDQVEVAITRDRGDRLALWGAWASRRATLAPASRDLEALALLACRSLVTSAKTNAPATAYATFLRDLVTLEQAIPLVCLTARLERKVAPLLHGATDSVLGMLAPLTTAPRSDAYLVNERRRYLALDRALLELEYARRSGALQRRKELETYVSALASDLYDRAFGARAPIGVVPGFDGTVQDVPAPKNRRNAK